MKNKRLSYVLLPLVLLVWGLIAQRIWFATTEAEPEEESAPVLPAAGPTTAQRRPTLLLSYDDPFRPLVGMGRSPAPLGGAVMREAVVSSPVSIVSAATSLNLPLAPPAAPAPPVVWPQVKYLGLIVNSGANNQVVLLAIDNQELLVKAGQSSHGVRLISAFRDSVQLSFSKQKKSFSRVASLP